MKDVECWTLIVYLIDCWLLIDWLLDCWVLDWLIDWLLAWLLDRLLLLWLFHSTSGRRNETPRHWRLRPPWPSIKLSLGAQKFNSWNLKGSPLSYGCFWFPLMGGRWHVISQLAIYHLYTACILPSGWLHATYHLLGEPETTIDFKRHPEVLIWLSTSNDVVGFQHVTQIFRVFCYPARGSGKIREPWSQWLLDPPEEHQKEKTLVPKTMGRTVHQEKTTQMTNKTMTPWHICK